ncbi:hypothetical protein ACFY12_10495 [Streptomyces sp. NPDC001339]
MLDCIQDRSPFRDGLAGYKRLWTKTAEEILDPLARFCRRISGAGH